LDQAFADKAYDDPMNRKMHAINKAVAEFNDEYRERYGMTLSICREPLETPVG
jgi:hypothetical protein